MLRRDGAAAAVSVRESKKSSAWGGGQVRVFGGPEGEDRRGKRD